MVVFETKSHGERPEGTSPIIVAATAFIVLVIIVAYAVLFHTLSATTANRIFGFSLLIMLLTSIWIYRMRILTHQASAWEETAAALGLRCKMVGNPLRMQTFIEGVCRGRFVQICVSRDTDFRMPVTCIDMELSCGNDAKMRIWGPFDVEQVAEYGKRRDFRKARRFGTDKSYYAFTNSPHLSANLFPPQIWSRLQAIDHPINISLVNRTLSFEQPGITYDSSELTEYVELLSQIAYVIAEWEVRWREQQSSQPHLMRDLAAQAIV